MDITPIIPIHYNVITAYGGGYFKVNDQQIEGNVIIAAQLLSSWLKPAEALTLANFEQVAEFAKNLDNSEPVILLYGTGSEHQILPPSLAMKLLENNIVIDAMSTPAACRTYNILLSEGRRVVAVLNCV